MTRPFGVLCALLTATGCIDTSADAWCARHPEICQTSLSSVLPSEGPSSGGTVVTLTGVAFEDDTAVLINGKPLQITAREGRTVIRGLTPVNPVGPADVLLRNANGEVLLKEAFVYRTPSRIDTVHPTTGTKRGGTRITVTGEHLYPGTRLFVGGQEATEVVSSADGLSLTGLTPPGTSLEPQQVRTEGPGGVQTLHEAFTYDPWERIPFAGVDQGSGLRRFARGGDSSNGALYVWSPVDLYRSVDNANSWTAVETPAGIKSDLVLNSADPSRVVLATQNGTFWSHDGGASWSAATRGFIPLERSALAIRDDGVVFAAGYTSLYRSDDGGQTFTEVGPMPLLADRLFVHGRNQNVLIAHGYNGYAISHDSGLTWPHSLLTVDAYSGYRVVQPGQAVGELWSIRVPASGGYSVIERSVDYGATFQAPPIAPPDSYWTHFAMDPQTGVLLLGDHNYVLQWTGAAWTQLGTQFSTVASLGFDLSGTPLLMDNNIGPRRWDGTGWTDRNAGMTTPLVSGLALDTTTTPRTLYVGTGGGEVLRSANGGQSWERLPALPNRGWTRTAVSSSAASTRTVYASQFGLVYRWTQGDPGWTPEESPVVEGTLLQEPLQRDILYAWSASTFHRKQPNGVWEDFAQGLPAYADGWQLQSPVTHMNAGLVTLYLVALRSGQEARIYYRQQADVSWQQLGNGLPLGAPDWVLSLGAAATHLLLSVSTSSGAVLWRIPQDGGPWVQLPREGNPTWVSLFLTDPSNRARIFALNEPILVSPDSGASWARLSQHYRYWNILDATMDPATPSDLFLAVETEGLQITYSGGE